MADSPPGFRSEGNRIAGKEDRRSLGSVSKEASGITGPAGPGRRSYSGGKPKLSSFESCVLFPVFLPPQERAGPNLCARLALYFTSRKKESLSRATREFILDKGDPPLLFSLGTSGSGTEGQRFCEVAAEASLLMDKRAILVTGSNTEIVQNIPRDDRLLPIAYEPFSQLVPQVRTLVHIGGVGTIAYGLHGGKPQVLVPFTYEQCDNALRLQDLGVSANDYR